MKSKKRIIFFMLLSLILLLSSIVCVILVTKTNKGIFEADTTEFSATVSRFEIKGTGDNKYGILYTNEYGEKLLIRKEFVNESNLVNLQEGQTIYFRIENNWVDVFYETDFVYIVSLHTDEVEIISLDQYNAAMHSNYNNMITAAVFTGILFLLVFVHCVLLIKGYNVFQKLKKFGTQSSNLYIPKKRRKKIIIIMSLALVFCMGMICNVIVIIKSNEGLSEINTTEHRATIKNYEINGTDNEKIGTLYTDEYNGRLLISHLEEVVDMNAFSNLQAGQTIYFRIQSVWEDKLLNNFGENDFIYIVSLRTNETDIMPLSNYNKIVNSERNAGITAGIVVSILLLFVFIHCILLLKGINILHKLKRQK